MLKIKIYFDRNYYKTIFYLDFHIFNYTKTIVFILIIDENYVHTFLQLELMELKTNLFYCDKFQKIRENNLIEFNS